MRLKYFALSVLTVCASAHLSVRAQNTAPNATGGFEILNKPTFIGRPNGARLEGARGLPARVRSQQIDLSAQVIALDYANQSITQMRAKTGVKLLLNLAKDAKTEAVRLEAQSDDMVLDPLPRNGRRSLTLTGNVNGFYDTGGVRNTLRGTKITISFGAQPSRDLRADIEGGEGGARIEVAAQNFGGAAGQLGKVVLTAQRATVDGAQGQARLIGNARAVSTGGENNFDVAASEFLVKFGGGATRSLDSLQTVGRAQIKISMPLPKPSAAAKPDDNASLRPTYVEVAADNATVAGANQTLTLDGNVQGMYRIPTQVAGAPTDYKFSGSRAVMRMVSAKEATAENPEGLNLDIASVAMDLPALDLGFGDEADDKKTK